MTKTLPRVRFYPCQLADGSTHVLGPHDRVIYSFTDPDLTVRWSKAKSYADRLNRGAAMQQARRTVAIRWALIVLALLPLIIDLATGGALSRGVVSWLMR